MIQVRNRVCHLLSLPCLTFFLGLDVFLQANLAAPATAAPPAPQIKYEKYTLKNGLNVILYEDHRLPLVAANIWYHVGPANERPGRTGFAHLFEHMTFSGSEHGVDKAHLVHLDASGAIDA